MNVSFFYPELARYLPGTPWPVFDAALNTAARTLCTLGLVWRATLEPVVTEAGVDEYDLFPPSGTRVVQILKLGDLTPTMPRQNRSGYIPLGDKVQIVPAPSERIELVPIVALSPVRETQEFDDSFAWVYERMLLHGALAALGVASWADFERHCYAARSRATDGNVVGVPRRVRYGGL